MFKFTKGIVSCKLSSGTISNFSSFHASKHYNRVKIIQHFWLLELGNTFCKFTHQIKGVSICVYVCVCVCVCVCWLLVNVKTSTCLHILPLASYAYGNANFKTKHIRHEVPKPSSYPSLTTFTILAKAVDGQCKTKAYR